MNSSTLRRLAGDHSDLHTSPLPPYYLFPPSAGIPDDLTQLTILLTGPQGTPYSQGLWKLHLKIPEDYPKNPPKAAFKTRIWHPNVEEVSGNVCVDTLKRDWESKLTLRDVLITISCLLIQPNPDSALNSTAGHLLQEDFESFSRQAKLMTSIHARIPLELKDLVEAAKQRGEEAGTVRKDNIDARPPMARKPASTSGVTMKKAPQLSIAQSSESTTRSISAPIPRPQPADELSDVEVENDENDPSLSPSLVTIPAASPRRPPHTKRPLSDLPTPVDPDSDNTPASALSPSEQNIAANAPFLPPSISPLSAETQDQEQEEEVIKLAERRRSVNFTSPRSQQDSNATIIRPFEDAEEKGEDEERPKKRVCSAEGKENCGENIVEPPVSAAEPSRPANSSNTVAPKPVITSTTVRKASAATRAKARIGLRRL